MSTRRRGSKQQGRKPQPGKGNGPDPNEFWRAMPELDAPEPIRPAAEPSALLRSLGSPPLTGHATVADHYLAAVIDRASGLATALAAASGILATADDDPA
jgi:hypothetical protein